MRTIDGWSAAKNRFIRFPPPLPVYGSGSPVRRKTDVAKRSYKTRTQEQTELERLRPRLGTRPTTRRSSDAGGAAGLGGTKSARAAAAPAQEMLQHRKDYPGR